MPTFAVRCASCNGERWPTLPERPSRYVCARCVCVGADVRAGRVQRAAKAQKSRQRRSGDVTGAAGGAP